MDADATGFYDPELLFYCHSFKRFQKLPNQPFEEGQGRIMGNSDDDNTMSLLRRKPQYIGKIQVERYQTTMLGTTDVVKPLVGAALQLLVPDSQNVVTACTKNLLRPGAKILIQLEFHPAATSTNRSRDISAPYAIAA